MYHGLPTDVYCVSNFDNFVQNRKPFRIMLETVQVKMVKSKQEMTPCLSYNEMRYTKGEQCENHRRTERPQE